MSDDVKSMVKKLVALLVAGILGAAGAKYLSPDFAGQVCQNVQQSQPAQK